MCTQGRLEGHCLNGQTQKQMLITPHGHNIISSYVYWKFKSTDPSDDFRHAHPTPRRQDSSVLASAKLPAPRHLPWPFNILCSQSNLL